MAIKKNVLYFVIDAESGVKLKYGVRYKDVSVLTDPFNVDYKYLFSDFKFGLFHVNKFNYFFRTVCINGRVCYIFYIYPFTRLAKRKDVLTHSGLLLRLKGFEVDNEKDIYSFLVNYCSNFDKEVISESIV